MRFLLLHVEDQEYTLDGITDDLDEDIEGRLVMEAMQGEFHWTPHKTR